MTFRLVHLSDIHFGQEKDGGWEAHDDVRNELLIDLERVRQTVVGHAADKIIVTGDIAQSGREVEYKTASAWLDQALVKAGSTPRAVLAVPGNHDVDLRRLSDDDLTLQDWMRIGEIEKVEQQVVRLAGSAESEIILKLSDYRSFAFAYGTDFESWSYPVTVSTIEENGQTIRFSGLCTALGSDRNDRQNGLFMSGSQYRIPRDREVVDIVFMHHPVRWLRNNEEIDRYLNSRVRMLLTGHEHQPLIDKHEYENGFEQLRLAAGATNPPHADETFRYSYSWLEIDWIEDGDGGVLRVTSYPRKWAIDKTCFEADKTLAPEGDFVVNDIKCDVQRPIPKASVNQKSDEVLSAISSTDRLATGQEHAAALDELRLFFWKHLQRSERIDLLIALGLLSERARDRLPASMERRAFEDAKHAKCLHELWNGVMERASPSERKANPFGAEE